MKRHWLLFCLGIPVLVVTAQEPGPAGVDQWTEASVTQLVSSLRKDASTDPHHFAVRQLADYSNEAFLLVHREGDGQVEWHETQVDIFFVKSGSATLLVGGTMVGGETVGPHEKRNGTIQGGVRRKLAEGDVVRISARVPHQVLLDGSHEFDYFVVKVKGY
jgi:mannose-6-phosphate isomerase-like protein (cupin superfamily)